MSPKVSSIFDIICPHLSQVFHVEICALELIYEQTTTIVHMHIS